MKVDPRFKDTEFVVEADSFAMQALWEKFSTQSLYRTPQNIYNWEQDCRGFMETIGHVNKMPVCVCFFWYKINGHLILFYEATSQVVDHRMIEEWLDKYCNPKHNGSKARCNASNFHHALGYIRDCEALDLLQRAKKTDDKELKSTLLERCWKDYSWAYDKEVVKEAQNVGKVFVDYLMKMRPSNGAIN
ncbi:hypothetical protein [Nitrospira sp. BLG_2]|uniref:hypothetical protein n=1 Tax=Nitrospira sp. BLG_2 TaxID=3397507 RepID=UPI003B9AFA28